MGAASAAVLLEGLPDRLRESAAADGRFRVRVGRTARDVVISDASCEVEGVRGRPSTEIATDPGTWRRIDAGRLSGIEAFVTHRLSVAGSIEKALQFEPAFERPLNGGLLYEISKIETGRVELSVLIAGKRKAPPLLLLHGLGATKASWISVIPALARDFRVIVPDLPGFGASSKPLSGYDAAWFASHMFEAMDALGYPSASVAGNSMGGRVAMEMAMQDPERVRAVACLCPATAFSHRPALWLARLARPELSMLLSRLPRRRLRAGLRLLLADPNRIDDSWYEAAIDDFLMGWKSPRARVAFAAALKHIYMEEPYGESGFWRRLELMKPPGLFVFGDGDALITPRFASKVRKVLPSAAVAVWRDCGHAPQLELPERTGAEISGFFARALRSREAV